MKKIIFIILSTILLTGCATSHLPETVDVPVPVSCPKPHIPPKPVLPIATLHPDDKPDVVVKAYVVSIKLLQGYNNELIQILESYKK